MGVVAHAFILPPSTVHHVFAGEGAVRKSVPIRKAVLPTLYIAAELRNLPY